MDDTSIPIEETPEIPMDMPPPPIPKVSRGFPVVTILVFLILFVAGMLLSGYIRPFFSGGGAITPTPTEILPTPTPTDPVASWKTSTIAGLSFKLPPDVLAPICDGISCVSQGTYLPGGTRFTVASRGQSAFVTDANGVAFVDKDATVSGHIATEFSGTFTGRTISGYAFSQMHGFMIEVTPTATLEINHFTPAGITADWVRDDALFNQIISTLSFTQETPPPTP
jgi:hypothetical protein